MLLRLPSKDASIRGPFLKKKRSQIARPDGPLEHPRTRVIFLRLCLEKSPYLLKLGNLHTVTITDPHMLFNSQHFATKNPLPPASRRGLINTAEATWSRTSANSCEPKKVQCALSTISQILQEQDLSCEKWHKNPNGHFSQLV